MAMVSLALAMDAAVVMATEAAALLSSSYFFSHAAADAVSKIPLV